MIMKPRKLLIAAMTAGMLLSGAAGVYAGTKLEKITAYLNHDIRFELNGEAYVPVDGSGEELAPILYNNTTYLPVRATAHALDVPVTYDEKTDVVIIGIKSAQGGGERVSSNCLKGRQ